MRVRLLVLIVLCLLTVACHREGAKAVAVDPSLLNLVPPDAAALAGVRVDKVKETPLYGRYVANLKLPGLERFVSQTGFDPRQNLYELLVVPSGEQTLVLARGKFQSGGGQPKLDMLDGQRVPQTTYKKFTLFGDERGSVVFLNSSVAAAGPAAPLKAFLDRRDGGKLGPSRELLALLQQVPDERQAWAVTLRGIAPLAGMPQTGAGAMLLQLVQGIDQGMASADFRQGMAIYANANFGAPEEAQRLRDAVRATVGLARLNTPEDKPELLRAYDAVKTELDGKTVKVEAALPFELLESMARLVPR